jgi:hypothetical protein
MKRIYTILISACLSLLLLTSSCSLFGPGGKIVASRLVTQTDAEKISGTQMLLSSEETSERESSCLYRDAAAEEDSYLQATFRTFASEEAGREAEIVTRTVKAEYGKIVPVEGIGDSAWLETDDISRTLHVRRGATLFLISATGGGADHDPRALEEMQRVAKAAALRL